MEVICKAASLVSLLLVFGGWSVVIVGCSLLLAAFLWNYQFRTPFPHVFPWWLFWVGWLPAAIATTLILLAMSKGGSTDLVRN